MKYADHLRINIRKPITQILIGTLIVMLSFRYLGHRYNWDWRFAAAFSYGLYSLFIFFAFVVDKSALFKKLLVFALVAGFTELISDWYLVSVTKTLVYYQPEPTLVSSPMYMPFSWGVILLQVGYLGWQLGHREKLWITAIVTVLLGCCIVPFFEYWAYGANWWYYQNCNMVHYVPYYIIASEGLICAALPWIFDKLEKSNYAIAFLFGVAEGLWILVTAFIALKIFG